MFAILGLRSLYFVLAGAMDYFRYLKVGLSLVLVFIGVKMLLDPHESHDPLWFQVDIPISRLAAGGRGNHPDLHRSSRSSSAAQKQRSC